jgi:hypothetical protein
MQIILHKNVKRLALVHLQIIVRINVLPLALHPLLITDILKNALLLVPKTLTPMIVQDFVLSHLHARGIIGEIQQAKNVYRTVLSITMLIVESELKCAYSCATKVGSQMI